MYATGLQAIGVPFFCGRIHNSCRKLPSAVDIPAKGTRPLCLHFQCYEAIVWAGQAIGQPQVLTQLCCYGQAMVQNLVRSTLSLTFVIAAARVVFNVKARMTREATWQLELKGDLTKQRRVEAVDKLLSVLTLLVASVFGLQAIGLDG